MRIAHNILTLCLLGSLGTLAACSTKPVTVMQPEQFTLMGNHMGEELISRKILDANMKYTASTASHSGGDYGKTLYARLSPSFLFDDVAKSSATTFASSLKKGENVHIQEHGFSISTAPTQSKSKVVYAGSGRRIDVSMVAISDWEGDGVKDWLISCRYVKKIGASPRVYYLAIPENTIKDGQSLQAKVISVYEDLGVTGLLYLRESQAEQEQKKEDKANKSYDAQQGEAHHVVPGLKNITAPPKANAKSAKPSSSVQAKTL